MMKAVLLFSTCLLNFASGDLPKLNTLPSTDGKIIKASTLPTDKFSPSDSLELTVVPEFHFTGDPGTYHIQTVVIDPGHGGHDPGCLGHNSREKHLALAIGKYLAADMRETFPGVNVIMTRSTDVFVPLHERAAIATRNKADLFISIHCNAFSRADAHGAETYVLGLHATKENLEVAKRENESILLEDNYQETYGYDPNSPEAHIMFSMFQNAFLEQSISFAEKVQAHAKTTAGRHDRGVKQAGFLVLRYATMPSVLVETGYLTNRTDENYLATDTGQRKMARSILLAFVDYKRELEGNVSGNFAVKPLPKSTPQPVVQSQKKSVGPSTPSRPAPTTEHHVLPVKQEKTVVTNPKPRRKIALEITPPPTTPKPKTNTSPTHSSKIMATQPVAPPPAEAEKQEEVQPDIQYCVQLAASPKLLDLSMGKWNRLDQTVEVVKEGGLFKYQVRNFATFDDASQTRSRVRSVGFSDAFVIAYRNGVRVDPRTLK